MEKTIALLEREIGKEKKNILTCKFVYEEKILKNVDGYKNHRALDMIEHSKNLISEYERAIELLKHQP